MIKFPLTVALVFDANGSSSHQAESFGPLRRGKGQKIWKLSYDP